MTKMTTFLEKSFLEFLYIYKNQVINFFPFRLFL
jgi:hypothetical protein